SEIEAARLALVAARNAKAETYANKPFETAQKSYDSAMIAWRTENERFVFNRDFDNVIKLANEAVDNAIKAEKQAIAARANLKASLAESISEINEVLKQLNGGLSRFPAPEAITNNIAKGRLLFSEGRVAFNAGNYAGAERRILDAYQMLNNAHDRLYRLVDNYFDDHPQWVRWRNETIAQSRRERIAVIIVDKWAGKCYVYRNGNRTHTFDAELGKNWIGHKMRRGDHVTPEGRYHVTRMRQGRHTIYHKSLMINYPNADDQKRFRQNIAQGRIPRNANIGGNIAIHGHGGKGNDWTQGCVALSNNDMDVLFRLVAVGTPVTIIGSVRSKQEIFNQ
ncbi:MAG TPA: L,D-transpeptidase family protein, partial [Bacteroidales bacterium]|nr:L,D-transpeptidase family protein [Bacteroidales bacterium]